MATRPSWTIHNGKVICKSFEFQWNGGFAITQKQKNIVNLHQAIKNVCNESALEVSSKGGDFGKSIGAFSLKVNGIYLENIFQAAKKYENGGPYLDLLNVPPKESKQDQRHHSSGNLISFVKDGTEWPLEPKTAFYDFIYVSALQDSFGQALNLNEYDWFTDIEFNPNKSINCQARSVAIYKLLQQNALFNVMENTDDWLNFHKEYVNG